MTSTIYRALARIVSAGCLLVMLACSSGAEQDGTSEIDAGARPSSSPPAKQLTGAAGRVSGGGFTMDVQLGHAVSRRSSGGAGMSVSGDAVVKP